MESNLRHKPAAIPFFARVLYFSGGYMMRATVPKIILLLMVFAAGCTGFPGEKGPVYTSEAPITPRPLIDQEELIQKMVSLQKKLQENRISEEDRPGAEALLQIYRLLQDAASSSSTDFAYNRLLARIYLRLEPIESTFQPPGDTGPLGEKMSTDICKETRDKIFEAYLNGDSQGVINQVLELKKRFGSAAVTPGISLVFAFSLAKQGLFKEAVDIGENTARELEKMPDLLLLQGKIAAWYSRLGKENDALLHYDKMNDLLDDRTALLNRLGEELHALPTEQETMLMPLPRVLRKVDEKLQARAYEQAKLLLLQKRQDKTLSADEINTINKTLEQIEKEKMRSKNDENEAVKKVRQLVEQERFDEALKELAKLKTEGIEGYEVAELQRSATEGFINRERKKAAALFLRARTAGSSLEKKEYLRKSHEILQKLLDKFPASPSRDKILRNMDMIDKELSKW